MKTEVKAVATKSRNIKLIIFKVTLSLLAAAFIYLLFVRKSLMSVETKIGLEHGLESPDINASSQRIVIYFAQWSIYARNFYAWHIDWTKVTNVLYAFANIDSHGHIILTDTWADTDIRWPQRGDKLDGPSNYLYGNLNQLYQLKKQYRNVKVSLSVGGWSYSALFSTVFSTAQGRNTFVDDAISFIDNYGLDGIDIDWEYPVEGGLGGNAHSPDDINNFILLLQLFRQKTATRAVKPLLSLASPAGYLQYRHWDFPRISALVDFINVMTYDFEGSWSTLTYHSSNMYTQYADQFSVNGTISDYVKLGCPASKVVIGCPMYGHSYDNTKGLRQPFTPSTQGSWEAGVWDYKALPLAGSAEYYDPKAHAVYSYDSKKNQLISFDDPYAVNLKANFVVRNNLGGLMFWEASGDRNTTDSKSLLAIAFTNFKYRLETSQNNINYPNSKFPNIRP